MAGPFQSRCIGPLRFGCIVPTAACRDESSRGRTFEQHNANCAYRDRADAVLGRRSFDSFCSRPRHIYSFHFLVQSLTIRVTWIKFSRAKSERAMCRHPPHQPDLAICFSQQQSPAVARHLTSCEPGLYATRKMGCKRKPTLVTLVIREAALSSATTTLRQRSYAMK